MCTGHHDFIPAPDCIKVELRCLFDDQQVENVFYVRSAASPTADDVQLAADVTQAWWHTNARPVLPNSISLIGVLATNVAIEGGFQYFETGYAGETGEQTGSRLPNNVAFCLNLNTALAGRSGRGKWFWYGLLDADVTGNRIATDTAAALKNMLDQLKSDLLADSLTPVVVSYCHNNAWRTVAGVNDVVSYGYHDLIVDSQRRRLPGRGR